MRLLPAFVFASAFAAAACGSPARQAAGTVGNEWVEFAGSWNAVGTRHSIELGAGRTGSIINLRGTLLLAGKSRPGVGFQSEVTGLVDSVTGLEGRSVWTDENGDRVFSELHGEGTAEHNRVTGTILSGTGRYAGASGSYEFSWQRLLEADDGAVQGRAVDLKGRVHTASPAGGSSR